jgi:hypothetical protein
MSMNILTLASGLSDHDLLARLGVLAGQEREATAELVAHLAALDARPSVYAALGFGSLFRYCTDVLRLSEDATCNRTRAARACRRFPMILDRLAAGTLSLTAIRLLYPHLTAENHEAVLARTENLSRSGLEDLVAELAPRPDVPSTIRKLPVTATLPSPLAPPALPLAPPALPLAPPLLTSAQTEVESPEPPLPAPPPTPSTLPTLPAPPSTPSPLAPTVRRPIIEATAPERYRVQFTLAKEGHDRLRRLQALLRREIPDGDPGAIVERALVLLLESVEKAKLGAARNPRPIRPGTDSLIRTPIVDSRHIPNGVKRAASGQDGGQCGFVARDGRRCTERTFLEFHHKRPFAQGGPATVDNISLRCRRHNQYEAQLVFGPNHGSRPSVDRPTPATLRASDRGGTGTTRTTPG